MGYPTCSVPDCHKSPRSKGSALCPMHYHRQYRHGSVDRVSTGAPKSGCGRRYQTEIAKGHPLAKAGNKVYVHRRVLFDTIGPGVHQCHWCKAEVEWFLMKNDPRSLHVDHLNDIGDDNRIENLVPSCQRCNGLRAAQRRAVALRERGFWSVNDTIQRLKSETQRRKPLIEDQIAA